jgi:ankyrin repeat protein
MACLLKHGAARDAKGLDTALFNASVRGPAAAVRLLLEHGANVNTPSGFAGYTPLIGAAYSENVEAETIRLLLARGAEVKSKAATGETALELARKRGKTEIVDLLLQAGASE